MLRIQGGEHCKQQNISARPNHFNNQTDGMRQDVKVKRANFINKNIELNQEFSFSHPLTKVKMNLIFNFQFNGSPVWDLFSKEAIMLENSWNTAVKVMFDLPVQTHRYIIEPISQTKHLKIVLLERFLSFLEQIHKSKKNVPKQLLSFIKNDARSTTGSNLRKMLLLTKKNNIDELSKDDVAALHYHEVDPKDGWKIKMIKEITDLTGLKWRILPTMNLKRSCHSCVPPRCCGHPLSLGGYFSRGFSCFFRPSLSS